MNNQCNGLKRKYKKNTNEQYEQFSELSKHLQVAISGCVQLPLTMKQWRTYPHLRGSPHTLKEIELTLLQKIYFVYVEKIIYTQASDFANSLHYTDTITHIISSPSRVHEQS